MASSSTSLKTLYPYPEIKSTPQSFAEKAKMTMAFQAPLIPANKPERMPAE